MMSVLTEIYDQSVFMRVIANPLFEESREEPLEVPIVIEDMGKRDRLT